MSRAAAAASIPPARRAWTTAAWLMRPLVRLLGRSGRGDVHRRRQPLDRVQRVIELEVLNALLLEVLGLGGEARVGGVVGLQQFVFDLRLGQQVAAEVDFTDQL